MDPVEKALQKSREEAPAPRRPPAMPRLYGGSGVDARTKVVPPPGSDGPLPKITYTRTKVVQVSEATLRQHRLLAGFHKEPISDTYRMLRVHLLQHLAQLGGSTVALCSPNAGEGKTLTAANLAISLALDPNHSALLVDLDLRRPRLQSYFGLKPESGLCDYLEGNAELPDCLVNPGIERLVILPVRRPILNSSELLSSRQISSLILELKHRFANRIVIFDLPPLLVSDDSLVILPQVDASILVVEEGKSPSGEIQRAFNLLDQHKLLGTVLNRSSEKNSHPYY